MRTCTPRGAFTECHGPLPLAGGRLTLYWAAQRPLLGDVCVNIGIKNNTNETVEVSGQSYIDVKDLRTGAVKREDSGIFRFVTLGPGGSTGGGCLTEYSLLYTALEDRVRVRQLTYVGFRLDGLTTKSRDSGPAQTAAAPGASRSATQPSDGPRPPLTTRARSGGATRPDEVRRGAADVGGPGPSAPAPAPQTLVESPTSLESSDRAAAMERERRLLAASETSLRNSFAAGLAAAQPAIEAQRRADEREAERLGEVFEARRARSRARDAEHDERRRAAEQRLRDAMTLPTVALEPLLRGLAAPNLALPTRALAEAPPSHEGAPEFLETAGEAADVADVAEEDDDDEGDRQPRPAPPGLPDRKRGPPAPGPREPTATATPGEASRGAPLRPKEPAPRLRAGLGLAMTAHPNGFGIGFGVEGSLGVQLTSFVGVHGLVTLASNGVQLGAMASLAPISWLEASAGLAFDQTTHDLPAAVFPLEVAACPRFGGETWRHGLRISVRASPGFTFTSGVIRIHLGVGYVWR